MALHILIFASDAGKTTVTLAPKAHNNTYGRLDDNFASVLPQLPRAMALMCLLLLAVPSGLAQDLPQLSDPPLPDLIAANHNVATTNPHAAADTRLCADVRNVGDADSLTRFFVSFFVDNADEGSVQVLDSLAPGGGVTLCMEFRIPAGNHQFKIKVDVEDSVRERNESNNDGRPRSFWISDEPRPDLQLLDYGVQPRVSRTGESQVFHAKVKNVGNLESGTTTFIDIRDSTGILHRATIPSLQPGQSTNAIAFTTPDNRPANNYIAAYVIDPDGLVLESDETNNYGEVEYVVSEHPAADLIFANVTLEGTFVERRTLRLDIRVANMGDRAAPANNLELFDGNTSLRNFTIPSLPAGYGGNITYHFTLARGNHTLRLVADSLNTVVERIETNNVHTINVTIEAPAVVVVLPNLAVTRLDAGPDDPRPNEVVTLTALVTNNGEVTARNVTVAFLADNDEIARVTTSRIEPDKPVTVTATWAQPAPRGYLLFAIVDPDNTTEELSEYDNSYAREFTIRDPTAPTAPSEGNTTPPATPPTTPGTGNNTTAPPASTPTTPPADKPVVTLSPVAVSDFRTQIRQEPGKVVGSLVVTLRNPNLEALGPMSVKYLVDGQSVKEVLASSGLGPAATRTFTSGDLDLPAGKHKVRVEIRMLGQVGPPAASAETTYDKEEGSRGIPAPGLMWAGIAIAAVALGTRARRRA